MNAHIFVVDSTTFKVHLEYLFAGTGAKNHNVDFNNASHSQLHHSTEKTLVGMIADASRIRKGDNIIFYLQQSRGNEGRFYGIFKAAQNGSFLDNNDGGQYLMDLLRKSLTFRVRIEQDVVYPKGITEWEALDEIRNIQSPCQMLWSLIYRKLKANRGNTMITIYESERLCQLIRTKNNRQSLKLNNQQKLSFDANTQEIVVVGEMPNDYRGRAEPINLLPRLLEKNRRGISFEAHLQAYITSKIGTGSNPSLDKSLLGGGQVEWLGNEVSCGVGMQRIDVMVSLNQNGHRVVVPVELKAVEAQDWNVTQLKRYVDWVEQYYVPNRPSDLQPVLLTKQSMNRNSSAYSKLVTRMNEFNDQFRERCKTLRYIEFSITNDLITFERIDYE